MEFAHRSVAYFGAYKPDAQYVSQVVSEYIVNKSGEFLDELWKLLVVRRPKGWGPPDLHALMELKEEAADNMEVNRKRDLPRDAAQKLLAGPVATRQPITQAEIDSWSTEDDGPGDRWLSREETAEALAVVMAKLVIVKRSEPPRKADYADPYHRPKTRVFANLDETLINAKVELAPEFYDETMSTEERMQQYVAKKRAIEARRRDAKTS
jgi:hypothetical protein